MTIQSAPRRLLFVLLVVILVVAAAAALINSTFRPRIVLASECAVPATVTGSSAAPASAEVDTSLGEGLGGGVGQSGATQAEPNLNLGGSLQLSASLSDGVIAAGSPITVTVGAPAIVSGAVKGSDIRFEAVLVSTEMELVPSGTVLYRSAEKFLELSSAPSSVSFDWTPSNGMLAGTYDIRPVAADNLGFATTFASAPLEVQSPVSAVPYIVATADKDGVAVSAYNPSGANASVSLSASSYAPGSPEASAVVASTDEKISMAADQGVATSKLDLSGNSDGNYQAAIEADLGGGVIQYLDVASVDSASSVSVSAVAAASSKKGITYTTSYMACVSADTATEKSGLTMRFTAYDASGDAVAAYDVSGVALVSGAAQATVSEKSFSAPSVSSVRATLFDGSRQLDSVISHPSL